MTHRKHMKVAVLLTNNDQSLFAQAFPNDGEKVVAKLLALRPSWDYQVVPVTQGQFPANPGEFDGYVITGSPASVNDPDAWVQRLKSFIVQSDAARLPMVGLCFGHQAIAAALGGAVGRPDLSINDGWGLGFATTQFTACTDWMQPASIAVNLLAAHQEQVLQVPPRAVVIGSNAFCPVAAMTIDQHIFTTQYHPEMSVAFMDQLIEHLAKELSPQVIQGARNQLAAARADDSSLFMQWVVNFIEKTR
jgi:GMP synthase-like glutamine amidotransferase